MKLFNYLISILFLILLLFSNFNNGQQIIIKNNIKLVNYKLDNYESFGVSSSGCRVTLGIVLNNSSQLIFSDNVSYYIASDQKMTWIPYTEDGKSVYYISILNIPIGSTNKLSFNVTDTLNNLSIIDIDIKDNPYICKKLQTPLDIKYSSDIYQSGLLSLYGFNIGFNFPYELDVSSALSCTSSISQLCFIVWSFSYYFVCAYGLDYSKINTPTLSFTIYDLYGGNQTFSFANTLFSYAPVSTSVIKEIDVAMKNNTMVISDNSDIYSFLNIVKVKYSSMNSYPIILDRATKSPSLPTVVYGTPDEPTLYYTFLLNYANTWEMLDITQSIKSEFNLTYQFLNINFNRVPFYTSNSVLQSLETNNLIIKSQITGIVSISTAIVARLINNGLEQKIIPFPYGYSKSSNSNSWIYDTEIMVPPIPMTWDFYSALSNYYIDNSIVTPSNFVSSVQDTESPILHSASTQIFGNKVVLTMNISDVGTGVYRIFGLQPSFEILAADALVSGDKNNGVYQVLVDMIVILYSNRIMVSCYDYALNEGNNENYYDYTNLDLEFPKFVENPITISDIELFRFDRLVVDTSFDDLEVTLYVKVKGADEFSPIPFIQFNYNAGWHNPSDRYFGVYNKSIEMYNIKFSVPARENGYLDYILVLPPLAVFATDINSLFPTQRIKLVANYVDHYAPIITDIKLLPSSFNEITTIGQEIELSWLLTIYDYPVGLASGYFEITSNLNFEPYVFNIKPDETVPGSDILSNYTITIKVSPLVNETFTLSAATLTDKNGYFSSYPGMSNLNIFSPFENASISQRQIKLNTTFSDIDDTEAPKLVSLSYPTSFDSFGINRTITFSFSTQDEGTSGVSTRHNPYIFIHSLYCTHIKVPSTLVSVDLDTNIHNYTATTTFDYGFLSNNALVSIHGITDNVLNVASITSSGLKEMNFPSTIVNPVSPKPPVISSFTEISENGGDLFIYGFSFGTSPNVLIDFGKGQGFVSVPIVSTSNLALRIKLSSMIGVGSFKVKIVKTNSLESNIETIIPTLNPVLLHSDCSAYFNCSGNGDCIDSKCVCLNSFSGPECLSSTIPLVNSKPEATTPSMKVFGSMISVLAIKEIDINQNEINNYPFLDWSAKTVKSSYTSNDAYEYTSKLGSTNTSIVVTVDIFDNPTSISFASKQLSMDKGTIKYTISLDSYPFKSPFNYLQLVVNASMSVSDSKCKLNQVGLTKDGQVEWIKLRSDSDSIYGKFIKQAVIDYRASIVSNQLLFAPTTDSQQAVIGITIPFYYKTAVLDPDFSVLLDSSDLAKDKKATCVNGELIQSTNENDNEPSSGLSKSKIIGISVGCAIFGVAFIFSIAILIKKKIYYKRFLKTLKVNQLK